MKFLFTLALIGVFFAQPVSVFATVHLDTPATVGDDDPVASPSPTPDAELEQLKREAALAEQRQKKAEAEQAEMEAKRAKLKAATDPFGDTSKVTAPSGDVKTDDKGFVEVRMLSLEAARDISGRLARNLCQRNNVQTLVIYDQDELKAIVISQTMVSQLGALSKELKSQSETIKEVLAVTDPKAEPTKVTHLSARHGLLSANNDFLGSAASLAGVMDFASVPGVAAGLISSIAQLANLFRTDTEFKNKDVQIPEDMAVSYLVSALNQEPMCTTKPVIYYPHLFPTNLFDDASGSPLLAALDGLRTDKQTAADKLKEVAARIDAIKEVAANIKTREALEEQKAKLEDERVALKKIDPRCRTAKCTKMIQDIATLVGDIYHVNKDIDKATGNNEKRFEGDSNDWLAALKKVTTDTQPLINTAEQVISKLDKADENSNTTALSQLLQAEKLGTVLNDGSTFMLRVAVSANGTTKIKKNIFIDAKVRHTAGADLVYQLFDNKGQVVMGDAMQFYFDYKSAAEVRDQVASHAKDSVKPEAPLARMASKSSPPKTRQN